MRRCCPSLILWWLRVHWLNQHDGPEKIARLAGIERVPEIGQEVTDLLVLPVVVALVPRNCEAPRVQDIGDETDFGGDSGHVPCVVALGRA